MTRVTVVEGPFLILLPRRLRRAQLLEMRSS